MSNVNAITALEVQQTVFEEFKRANAEYLTKEDGNTFPSTNIVVNFPNGVTYCLVGGYSSNGQMPMLQSVVKNNILITSFQSTQVRSCIPDMERVMYDLIAELVNEG